MLTGYIYILKLKRFNVDYNFYNRLPKIKKLDLRWSGLGGTEFMSGADHKNLIILSSLFFSLFLNKDAFRTICLTSRGSTTKKKTIHIYKPFSRFDWSHFFFMLNLFAKLIEKLETEGPSLVRAEHITVDLNLQNVLAKFFKLEGRFNVLNIRELGLLLTLQQSQRKHLDQNALERFFSMLVRAPLAKSKG